MIAAGEVVERIVNVVKELIENSLDAGATRIQISLKDSGFAMVQVSDNGSGMDPEDSLLAFSRHATSKIKNEYDLFHITSLGFRGEALPSIASVSRVEMETSDKKVGTRIVYEDGRLLVNEETATRDGTTITVTRLFFNTPARFKYLKTETVELRLIVDFVDKMAFAHPDVAFRLENNGRMLLQTSGNNSETDIFAVVYGLEVAKSVKRFSGKNRDYSIEGYFANPIHNRSGRQSVILIVNGRPIRDFILTREIVECFIGYLPKDKYPIILLNIAVDPQLIDVNIHPTKAEVKFSELETLRKLISETLKEAIGKTKVIQTASDKSDTQIKMGFGTSYPNKEPEEGLFVKEEEEIPKEDKASNEFPDFEYVGQYGGTYLLFQNEAGLYLVDQHAAAERIRYEKYLNLMLAPNKETYQLLLPMELSLSNTLTEMIGKDTIDKAKENGLVIRKKDLSTILLETVPSWYPKGHEADFAETVVSSLIEEGKTDKKTLVDETAKLLACKRSLKANHRLSREEAERLVGDLSKCNRPYTCPHGRPIIVLIGEYDIEKWFYRVAS